MAHSCFGVLTADCDHQEFSGEGRLGVTGAPWEFPEPEWFRVAVRVAWEATEQGDIWKEGTKARRWVRIPASLLPS